MRIVEWIYLIFNVVMLVWLIGARNKPLRMLWGGFAVSAALLLVHGLVEGLRWPLIPGYLLTLVPLIVLVVKTRNRSSSKVTDGRSGTSSEKLRRIRMIASSVLVLIYAAVALGLPLLFPILSFKKPTGPYGIGTVTYNWTDNSREEVLTPETGDKRELVVQIWYPTSKDAKGTTASYVSDPSVYKQAFHDELEMPKLLFTNLGDIKTHAIQEAKLSESEAKYPALVFSHGLHGYESQNTFQVEQLVGNGYIVVGINHTYSSLASVFPDGRVAYFESQGKEGFEKLKFNNLDVLNEGWVKDVQFVLDEVEKLAANDPDQRFTGHMDLDRIGMFGHSFGGATAVQMLLTDSRVKAGMNMDGVLYGEKRIPAEGVGKPFLMISADDTLNGATSKSDEAIAAMGTNREVIKTYYEEVFARYAPVTAGGNYWMKFNNTVHLSFSDLLLVSPLLEWAQGVDARGTQELVNDYTLDFFNHFLKGLPFEKLDQSVGKNPEFSLEQG